MGEVMLGKKLTPNYICVCIVGIDAVRKYLIKFHVFYNISDSPQLCRKQGVQSSAESEEAAYYFS
jgi:hypothetical protein